MNKDEAINKMRTALNLKSSSGDLTRCVITLNENGISAQVIYELLQRLREDFSDSQDEVKEDAILDTMDYVCDKMK